MLKMPQQQYIRFLREVEGCSIQDIADRVGVHWRTAKKYADKEDWNAQVTKRKSRFPIMGPFMEIVDSWLEEDRLLPRKQRHTATRIFQRLRDEYGFTGSDRTVLNYVKRRKAEMELERAKTYERLEHPPGEAQADFTTIEVCRNHQLISYKLLVLSFPYSNAAFVYPVPAENQECFLEAMKQVFEQMGGVPQRIWFDNLSAAVVHIEKQGERQLTDMFRRFCAHYRFEAVFCNPYSGHEKGHVEAKCGYSKRNWAVPVPVFESHEQLALHFAEQAEQDRRRPHYAKQQTIEELWRGDEKRHLLQLPADPFEAYRLQAAVVNKYGEIRVDETTIPLVGQVAPGTEVIVQLFWDRLVLLNPRHESLLTVPRPYTGRTAEIPWTQVFANWLRKPRSVTHSQFLRMLPAALQAYVTVGDLALRKERLQAMHHWGAIYSLEQIADALLVPGLEQEVSRVTAFLGMKYGGRDVPVTWRETLSPPGTRAENRLERYDRLVGVM
jgi:transposase